MEQFFLDNWLSVAVLAFQGLWGWLLWSLRKQFVSAEAHEEARRQHAGRMDGIEDEVGNLSRRVDLVERDAQSLPALAQGMNDLGICLERLRGEVMGLRAEMAGQKDAMKAIERQMALLMENELRGARDGD
ncbi:MAG: DUF2730 domain-containing protein [Deltaproteobacteria bacterium]|jgi:hypothetical protein|nr:DUF2730 domain-containing protein [Deltaproteobacteria bacterium]